MASALAKQYFGCFISMHTWNDWWLVTGIANFVAYLHTKKLQGNNEYKQIIYKQMKEVCSFEKEQSYVNLDLNCSELSLKEIRDVKANFLLRHATMASLNLLKIAEKKAHLVFRIIDDYIGHDVTLQILAKSLGDANAYMGEKSAPLDKKLTEGIFLLSIDSFSKHVSNIANKDIKMILENWVYKAGIAKLNVSYSFNRKKNTVEIELKQDMVNQKGIKKYIGPLTVTLQEIDGSFTHNLSIEDVQVNKYDILCHSKGKKSKKKKIPLITGEEVDIEVVDNDSPVLWIRIDPDLKLIREVKFEQQESSWQNQLKHERDIYAQFDAMDVLCKYQTPSTRATLVSITENGELFYGVRTQAALALAEVSNRMASSWNGPCELLTIFRKMYMSPLCTSVVSRNNFADIQLYFIQRALVLAIAQLRNSAAACPSEIINFIIELIRYNENSKNQFSDSYYKADLLEALVTTLADSLQIDKKQPSIDHLNADIQSIIYEVVLQINLEKIKPTYRFLLTCNCLRAFRRMQKLGHIPENLELFRDYMHPSNFIDVRMTAFEIFIEYLTSNF
jgi:transcription initiation factor TFIID subunit 2